ncbi:MAG TPA: hypothetical protein VMR43_16525 [Variovorax sp.]|nr:hypothetical protein [Variovorax sp.]
MNAALKMPRIKASTPRKPGRTKAKYAVATGDSLPQRIETLWAAFTTADELIEGAYDAAAPGSPIEHLLDHVSHDLLAVAIEPMRKDRPTRADAEETYKAMTATLAGLQGVMSMAAGSLIAPRLQEGFELLEWFQRECQALAQDGMLPAPDLATDFARGRDLAIAMMREAVGIGHEREPWRNLRGGQAQDNLAEGYLRDVIEDASLRPGFTAILSAAIQNETSLDALATITLAETQAGEIGGDGTEGQTGDDLVFPPLPDAAVPEGDMDEAAGLLCSAASMLDHLLQGLNCGAAYGAQTLMTIAEKSTGAAIVKRTNTSKEEASSAILEARDVLKLVAEKAGDSALCGVLALIDLAKGKIDSTIKLSAEVEG